MEKYVVIFRFFFTFLAHKKMQILVIRTPKLLFGAFGTKLLKKMSLVLKVFSLTIVGILGQQKMEILVTGLFGAFGTKKKFDFFFVVFGIFDP